ncbi:thiamine-triphosphatase-like [Amblyomma americanum]
MAGAEPARCCREVERKFKVPPDIEQRLLSLGAELVSQKAFVDTYYDTEDCSLCLRDHWLRLRSEKNAWELKYRRKEDASCGAATAYREEQGDVRILETLRALLPEAGLEKGATQVRDLVANETLRELAVIKTVRRTFKMPTNAVVDIDETDWGLSVGEIEIVLHEADAEALAGAVQNATAEIAQLAAQLGVQDGPPPEGKVESYLRLQRPALYRRLVEDIWPHAKAKDACV